MILPFWIRFLAAAVIISAITGIGWAIHHHIYMSGWDAHKAETEAIEKKNQIAIAKELEVKTAAVHETEHLLARSMDKRELEYRQGEEHAKTVTDGINADLRDHRLRLFVATRPGAVCRTAKDPGAGAADGTGGKGSAELDPSAAEFLVSIAAAGDKARRKHAAVVDAYNELRTTCAGASAPAH